MSYQSSLHLNLPAFLSRTFDAHSFCSVDIDNLRVGLCLRAGDRKAYVPVVDTPHYMFARHILRGKPVRVANGYDCYSQYISLHPHQCTEERFIELVESLRVHGYDAESRPILVFRSWRRPWLLTRWDVADGFHRLAILAAMEERHIQVMVLKQKNNIFHRFARRFTKRCRDRYTKV